MSQIIIATQTPGGTWPGAASGLLSIDSTTKDAILLDDLGNQTFVRAQGNANTGDVTCTSADTYITGSSITFGPGAWTIGQAACIRWRMLMTKTGFGSAQPVWTLRLGANQTTSDSALLTITGVAQTAASDTAFVEVTAAAQAGGALDQFGVTLTSLNGTTGFATQQFQSSNSTGGAWGGNYPSGRVYLGLSVNPGASAVWTIQYVEALGVGF